MESHALQEADSTEHLRLLLVDPRDLVHLGFRSLLRSESWVDRVDVAGNSTEALELAMRYRPHVAIIDTGLAGESAAGLCEEIRALSPTTRILLTSGDRVSEPHARSLGVAGLVPNTWPGRDIAAAARGVALGKSFFTAEPEVPDLLSRREHAVLGMLVHGATNREIAQKLYLSPHTVKDHVSAIYRKLKARNRAEAVVRAQRLGLLG